MHLTSKCACLVQANHKRKHRNQLLSLEIFSPFVDVRSLFLFFKEILEQDHFYRKCNVITSFFELDILPSTFDDDL